MANPLSPADEDPFAQIDPGMSSPAQLDKDSPPPVVGQPAPTNDNEPQNPFADLGPEAAPGTSGTVGAFARGAEKGALPAAASLAGAGLGAEVGEAVGPVIGGVGGGYLGFRLGQKIDHPVAGTAAGAVVGAGAGLLGGGILGALGGGYLFGAGANAAQDWGIKHLPDSWQDALGFSDRQARLDENQHAGASFLGGLLPYAVTMSPRAFAGDLPENATALQRILANPVVSRLFGGALMGGMEAGNEKLSDENLDWRKVAIATVFGTVFNRPNRLGEKITEAGAAPIRGIRIRPVPTVAQVADSKTFGPGVTEQVFQGSHEQAPEAAMTAQENARAEQSALGETPEPDVNTVARQMEPELFEHYDRLRSAKNVFEAAGAADHLADINAKILDMTPEIAAAYRRAAETTGTETVEPEQFPSFAAMLAAHEHGPVESWDQVVARAKAEEEAKAENLRRWARGEPQISAPINVGGGNVNAETLRSVQESPSLQPGEPVPGVQAVQQPSAQEAVGGEVATPAAQGPQRSIGEQRAAIADDVARRLTAAGRPADEAQAAGQLVAARYVTRAGRFGGKLGSPEDLYLRESAAIGGATGKALAPSLPTPAEIWKKPQTADLFQEAQAKELEGIARGEPSSVELRQAPSGPSALQPHMHGAGLHATEQPSNLGESVSSRSETGGLISGKSLIPVMDEVRSAAIEQGQVLDSIVGLVPVDVVNNLFSSEGAAKVALHDEAMLKDTPAFNADLPIADLSERSRAVRLLIGEIARQRTEGLPEPSVTVAGAPEGIAAAGADQDRNLYQGAKIRNASVTFGRGRPLIKLLKTADASSFVHESGHVWLEELIRDAAHPEAPMDLRDDAQTVRDWLGVTDDLKTKHEKFARGFEQYMREGVAPSPGLARVFAKFRNWLLSIYQSIKGLGTEISPEVRGVFDRMLEMQPQRTVIAPERPSPTLLHDIHEAEAAHVEPHEAEGTGDRTAAETERYIQENPHAAEAQAAVEKVEQADAAARGETTQPAGEAGENAEAGGPMAEGGARPEPQSGGGAGGAQRGAIKPGGGAGVSEGTARRPDLRSKLGDSPGTALAPGPTDIFGPRESPFTDRAGNIRLENLTNSQDVRQAIHEAADKNNDFIGATQGVVTDGQVLDLANDIGMPGAEDLVSKWVKGQAYNAGQVVALRRLLRESASELSQKMKQAAVGSDADVEAYAIARDRHQLIQRTVAGATAEAGRALRAFRNIAGEEGTAAQALDAMIRVATGKTLYQLRAEARLGAKIDTPEKINKFMQDAPKRNFGRGVLEYWVNCLISGPITHITYGVGNEISAIMRAGPETAAAAAIGAARRALGREGDVVRFGEIGAQFKAHANELPAALQATVEGARTGMSTLLPGEEATPGHGALNPFAGDTTLVSAKSMTNAPVGWHELMADSWSAVRGIKDAFVASGTLASDPVFGLEYSPLGQIPDLRIGSLKIPIGTAIRLPSRLVSAEHSFFRMANYSMERSAEAYRQATNEAETAGQNRAWRDNRIAEIMLNPTQEQMDRWIAGSTHATLMGQGGAFVQKLSRMMNHEFNVPGIGPTPLLKFMDPFIKISGNIIDQSIVHRTPVGLLSPEIRADLLGKNGNIAQDKAMGRMLVGTGLALASGSLAAQGLLSGSGPSDRKEAAVWQMAGYLPHSVRIGDFWYQVNKLGPYGVLASISADLFDIVHDAADHDVLKAAMHLQHAFTQNILDESFMKGPSDLIKAVDDPGRYGENYIKSFLSSFVPASSFLTQINRNIDPYQRETRNVIDTIKAKLPGLSQDMLPRRDIWGEEVPSRHGFGYATSVYEQKMSQDPVNRAMWRIGVFPSPVKRTIRNVQLTPDQYDEYSRIAGRMAKMRLDKIVVSPQFQNRAPAEQHDIMVETIGQCRTSATEMMLHKYPNIIRDAHDMKVNKRQAISDRDEE